MKQAQQISSSMQTGCSWCTNTPQNFLSRCCARAVGIADELAQTLQDEDKTDTHTHTHRPAQTHKPSTVTLAAHARRGLITKQTRALSALHIWTGVCNLLYTLQCSIARILKILYKFCKIFASAAKCQASSVVRKLDGFSSTHYHIANQKSASQHFSGPHNNQSETPLLASPCPQSSSLSEPLERLEIETYSQHHTVCGQLTFVCLSAGLSLPGGNTSAPQWSTSAFCLLIRLVALRAFSVWTFFYSNGTAIPTMQRWHPSMVFRGPGRTRSTLIRMGITWIPIVVHIHRNKVFVLHTLHKLTITVHTLETKITKTSHNTQVRQPFNNVKSQTTLKPYISMRAHQPKRGVHTQRSTHFTSA